MHGHVLQVAGSGYTGFAICADCDPAAPNTVWAWGSAWGDLLGVPPATVSATCHPDTTQPNLAAPCSTLPVEVRGPDGSGHLSGIVRLSTDGVNVLAIDAQGAVWAWGNDTDGAAGPGPTSSCDAPGSGPSPVCVVFPQRVPVVHDAVDVAAAGAYSIAVQRDGTVWAWGDDSAGELGQGTDYYTSGPLQSKIPLEVKNPKDASGYLQGIIAVAASDHIVVIQKGAAQDGSDNTMWAWGGDNTSGELGTGYVGSAGSGSTTLTVDYPQQVVTRPGGSTPFTGALAVTAGDVIVRFDASGADTVWGWGTEYADGGAGDYPQSEVRTTPRQFHAGSGGDCNTPGPFLTGVPPDPNAFTYDAAIVTAPGQSDGTVWLWGVNNYGPYAPEGAGANPSYDFYNCRFPVQAQGVTASAIATGGVSHIAIGQVLGPPPTPSATPTTETPPPPLQSSGPAPAAANTPPQPGVPVTQPAGFPAAAQGQPPGPGGGTLSAPGAQAPVSGPGGQGGAVSLPGSAAVPGGAPGSAPGAYAGPVGETAPGSAEDYAMVRHDNGPFAVLGLTVVAAIALGGGFLSLGRRRGLAAATAAVALSAPEQSPGSPRAPPAAITSRWDW